MQKVNAAALVELRKQAIGKPCPLCQEPMLDMKLCVADHDHRTGEIRGCLCRNCNSMLGKVENAATRAKRGGTVQTWLAKAAGYVQEAKTGYMYPTHLTTAEKAAKAAAKRKASAAAKAAAKLKGKQ